MNILLSAYTCGAGCGSEPGVGWNVARGLALRGHHVTVVTSPLYREQTQQAIEEEKLDIRLIQVANDTRSNLFIKRHVKWQKKAALILRDEAQKHHYDVVHHVTFNQYRGLRDVFRAGLPFLIGPIGGAETISPPFLLRGGLSPMVILKEMLRYFTVDAIPAILRCNHCPQQGKILFSNDITAQRLTCGSLGIRLKRPFSLLPAIALDDSEICASAPQRNKKQPYMLFYGSLKRPEKGIRPVLEAFARYRCMGGTLTLVLVGMDDAEKGTIQQYGERLGIPHGALMTEGFVKRSKMLELMQGATAMLYAGYRDSGAMSALEAVAQGINVICFDIPSQHWLPAAFATKVPIPSLFGGRAAIAQALANGMLQAEKEPEHSPEWHRARVAWLQNEMTWASRLTRLEAEYHQLQEKATR